MVLERIEMGGTKAFARRSSTKEVLLEISLKLTVKYLCRSLFLITSQACSTGASPAQDFPCEFCNVFINTIFAEHSPVATSKGNLWEMKGIIATKWIIIEQLLSQGKFTLHKKCFLLRISLVNVTKSAVSCGFGHIY